MEPQSVSVAPTSFSKLMDAVASEPDLGYECCLKKVGVNCWVYVYTLDGGLYPDSTPFSAYQPQTS